MSLILTEQPGFTAIAAETFNEGNAVTEETMKALLANINFAAVRTEDFSGYYRHGDTVLLPTSPADAYEYTREELRYSWSLYYSGPATSACAGTQTPPSLGGSAGQGTLLGLKMLVDQATGVVSCTVSYYKTAQSDQPDGVLVVTTHARRLR